MTFLPSGDVVWVAFPYVERSAFKARPAVVISRLPVGPTGNLFWAAMITRDTHARWPNDIVVQDLAEAGLPAPSIVRIDKLTTLESAGARKIGVLSKRDWSAVQTWLEAQLGETAARQA